jgi:hypothetical protein
MGWLGGIVQTLLSDPLTTPINRSLGDSPGAESSAFTTTIVYYRHLHNIHRPTHIDLPSHPSHVWDRVALGYLIPIFDAHRVLSSKTTLTMPSRIISQRLHPDEGLPQSSDQNHPCQTTIFLTTTATQLHPPKPVTIATA